MSYGSAIALATTRRVFSAFLAAAVAATLATASPANAQANYPSRSITIVVPIAVGVISDILARLYADKLTHILNTTVVVVNRPGAGGLIGAQSVISSPADGYTVMLANAGHMNLGLFHKQLTFSPVNDFVGVAMIGDIPSAVNVSAALGVKSLKEFVDLAKQKPGSINYIATGVGSNTHIGGAYFEKQANVKLTPVFYKDTNTAASDLVANLSQVVFTPLAAQAGQIQAGTILALAVGAKEPLRTPIFVPTAISQGVDYEFSSWYGILVQKGTPPDIIEKLSNAIGEAHKDPEFKAKIEAQGLISHYLPAAPFAQRIRADIERLSPVVKEIEAMPR